MEDATKMISDCPNANTEFFVSLNASGLGDQIMAARVATWLGESVGLKFAGLVATVNDDFGSRSSYSGETTGEELLQSLKLDGLLAKPRGNIDIYKVGFPLSIEEIAFEIRVHLQQIAQGTSFAIHLDGAQADHFYRTLIPGNYTNIFSTSFDRDWAKFANSHVVEDYGKTHGRDRSILIHLRLGDIANLKIPGGLVVVPNHFVHLGRDNGLKNALLNNFERYDKTAEILSCIRKLRNSSAKIFFHSDGFSFTRAVIRDHASQFAEIAELSHFEREIKQREEELLDHLSGLQYCIGENQAHLSSFVHDVRQCSAIISTTGHFAYNIATAFVEQRISILTEKFARTSIDHPKINPLYWTENFSLDLAVFLHNWQRTLSNASEEVGF